MELQEGHRLTNLVVSLSLSLFLHHQIVHLMRQSSDGGYVSVHRLIFSLDTIKAPLVSSPCLNSYDLVAIQLSRLVVCFLVFCSSTVLQDCNQ